MNTEKYGDDSNVINGGMMSRVFTQTFVAVATPLRQVSVVFATYMRRNTTEIKFSVMKGNTELFTTKVKACDLVDNAFYDFKMELDVVPGERYSIVLSQSSATNINNVTMKFGSRRHTEEYLSVDGRKFDAELSCVFIFGEPDPAPPPPPQSFFRKGMISVVIPVFNDVNYLPALFGSLSAQTYNYFEAIVVDDGSENHAEAEMMFNDIANLCMDLMPVRFEWLGANSGAPVARNKGAEKAIGEYLFFCDSDVVLDYRIFEKMLLKMHVDSSDWCYCNFTVGDTERRFMDFSVTELLHRNMCSTMSLMKHEIFPGFKPDLRRLQDWDVFATMAKKGYRGVWLDEFLFKAEDRPGITNSSIEWHEAVADLKKYHPEIV